MTYPRPHSELGLEARNLNSSALSHLASHRKCLKQGQAARGCPGNWWELVWNPVEEAPGLARPLSPRALIYRAVLCLDTSHLPPAEREVPSDPGTCPPTDVSQWKGPKS